MQKFLITAGAVLLAVLVAAPIVDSAAQRYAKNRVIAELHQRYGSDLEFSDLDVDVLPSVTVDAENVAVRYHGRRDVPPVILIRRLTARAGLLAMIRSEPHIRRIDLEGLIVTVPPSTLNSGGQSWGGAGGGQSGRPADEDSKEARAVVDRITCDAAVVLILPKKDGDQPLRFDIHHLVMKEAGKYRTTPFTASLHNPSPPGEIEVSGDFGPWHAEDPGRTPVAAQYRLEHADLGHFKGIGGITSSTGKFGGVLGRIVIDGETHTPGFVVRTGDHPMPLDTVFHAIVDGTTGNTLLEPVHARLGESTRIVAKGGVIRKPGDQGRTVTLDVTVPEGRVQDFLRLAVDTEKPPMTGEMTFRTTFDLPPGDAKVRERLRMDGQFGIGEAKFTSFNVQEKVAKLSKKGQGKPEEPLPPRDVISDVAGRFHLGDGTIRFTDLRFAVPGAFVELSGTYGLENEALDFSGKLRLAAKASQTTTGVKSFFLKLVDPFLSKHGAGTEVPIRVKGTRKHPDFGLALPGKH